MSLPRSITELTPARLTELLRPRLRGTVTAVQAADHAGGVAVTSRVSRLLLTVDGDPDFPRSVVAKVLNPAWTHGPALHLREHRFYSELATGLPVPGCWASRVDPDGAFVLLLEDLSEAAPGHVPGGWSADQAEVVVDALADLHRACWEAPRLRGLPRKSYSEADIAEAEARFASFWPRLTAAGTYPVSPAVAAAARRVGPTLGDAMRALSGGPATLVHADIHAENVLLDARVQPPRVVFIDWQNAAAGHPAFDLAGALCVATSPEAQRTAGRELLRRYHARLDRPIALPELEAAVYAGARRIFAGVTRWLVLFEEESLRDAATAQDHWRCLSEGLLVWG